MALASTRLGTCPYCQGTYEIGTKVELLPDDRAAHDECYEQRHGRRAGPCRYCDYPILLLPCSDNRPRAFDPPTPDRDTIHREHRWYFRRGEGMTPAHAAAVPDNQEYLTLHHCGPPTVGQIVDPDHARAIPVIARAHTGPTGSDVDLDDGYSLAMRWTTHFVHIGRNASLAAYGAIAMCGARTDPMFDEAPQRLTGPLCSECEQRYNRRHRT